MRIWREEVGLKHVGVDGPVHMQGRRGPHLPCNHPSPTPPPIHPIPPINPRRSLAPCWRPARLPARRRRSSWPTAPSLGWGRASSPPTRRAASEHAAFARQDGYWKRQRRHYPECEPLDAASCARRPCIGGAPAAHRTWHIDLAAAPPCNPPFRRVVEALECGICWVNCSQPCFVQAVSMMLRESAASLASARLLLPPPEQQPLPTARALTCRNLQACLLAQHMPSSLTRQATTNPSARTLAPFQPWGGVKNSGFGRELGTFGLESFLSVKQVGPGRDCPSAACLTSGPTPAHSYRRGVAPALLRMLCHGNRAMFLACRRSPRTRARRSGAGFRSAPPRHACSVSSRCTGHRSPAAAARMPQHLCSTARNGQMYASLNTFV